MRLSFKQQIVATVLAAALIPLALVSLISIYSSYNGSRALAERGFSGIGDGTMRLEETIFSAFESNATAQARSEVVHQALKDFTSATNALDVNAVGVDMAKLRQRYEVQQQKTPGTSPDKVDSWIPADPKARALQYLYIIENKNQLGEKDKLDAASDGSEYTRVHAKYHRGFRDYLSHYRMYDYFLVDAASGNIVYSAFKEIDFMSNVKEGPLADSPLSSAVKKALASSNPDDVFFSDMEAYFPSYNEHAMFVAAPIVEGGKTVGAIAFQISTDKMRAAFEPLKEMGSTADGFLIGRDMQYRTDPLVEVADVGDAVPPSVAEIVKGIFDGTRPEGVYYYKGGDGIPMTGVFRKMDIAGESWVMLVGQDDAEMLAATFRQLYVMIGIVLVASVLVALGGALLGGKLVKPLQAMAHNFASSAEKVGRATTQVGEAVSSMVAASEETSSQSKVVRRNSSEASGYVNSVSGAVGELNTSINDISRSIGETNHLIDDAVEKARRTNEVVRTLGDASKKITEVVSLINDLAEQTNLLALNAAIEAARAGDAGRGFAVVADEVKKLASNTSQATVDIKEQVKEILEVSEQSVSALQTVVEAIHRIRDNATSVSAAVEEQSGVAKQIASSVHDAAHRVQQVDENMNGIEQAANDTGVAADQVNGSSQEVQTAFSEMKRQMQTVMENMGIKI